MAGDPEVGPAIRVHSKWAETVLQYVLPRRFPRIRYFGLLAKRGRSALLPLSRRLLGTLCPAPPALAAKILTAVHPCPQCKAPMRIVQRLTAAKRLRELS